MPLYPFIPVKPLVMQPSPLFSISGRFLAEYDGSECRVRFDVISILALGNGRALMRHYVNAFGSGR